MDCVYWRLFLEEQARQGDCVMDSIVLTTEYRMVAALVGLTALIHFACMANYLVGKKAHVLVAILGVSAASGGVMSLFSLLNDVEVVFICSLCLCTAMFVLIFWLWHHGFKICEFVNSKD